MRCPRCRNVIPSSAKFCAYCGEPSPTLAKGPPLVTRRHGLPSWRKWVIGLVAVGLIIVLVHGLAGYGGPAFFLNPFSDPLDKAYEGAYRWAKHKLPSEKYVSIPQSGYPTDAVQSMKSEVTYCTVVGKHAWAIAYYGLGSYYDTRINPRASLRELFPPTGYILYSSDCGRGWEIQKQVPDWCPLELKFTTETEGYAVGDTGILHTGESGKQWSFLSLPSEIQKIAGVISIEGHHLVISCNDDWAKYESFDGGKTWQRKID